MKKIYTSIVAAAVLSTGAYAESNSIKDAFANGATSGDISIYTESVSNDTGADSGVTIGSIGLNYQTDSFNGLQAAFGVRMNSGLAEKEDGDYDGAVKAAVNTANISYSMENVTVVAGRQEIDLEWMGDFHEALVGVFTFIPDTTIVVGHTERTFYTDADDSLTTMADIGEDGANVLDVKYEGIANTVINPYFMDAPDLFSAYGIKATTTVANVDLTGHYAMTNEDTLDDDGSIAHLEVGTTISDISVALGYVMTDKDAGAGSITALGDNIDPTESLGDSLYGADASTIYASVSTEVSMVTLGALYATVDHADDTDTELTLTAGVALSDELSLDVLYSTVSMEDSSADSDTVSAMLAYSF